MVVLSLEGEIGGEMILTFDEVNGRQLAASLLGRPVGDNPQWSELEKSALTETGNILGCAYVNAITRLIDHELVPSAPYFIQDFGASVLQQALMVQALTSDQVLICRTGFHKEGAELNWHVLFVPTAALRQSHGKCLASDESPHAFEYRTLNRKHLQDSCNPRNENMTMSTIAEAPASNRRWAWDRPPSRKSRIACRRC